MTFWFFCFTINNEYSQQVIFKEFAFAFTIRTFSEIMKALALVEHLSTTGFENSH